MAQPGGGGPIVFFDGTCGLCDRSVSFLLQRDRRRVLRFAPLQGETAAKMLTESQRLDLDSLVFVAQGRSYERSTAVLMALASVGGGWGAVGGVLLWVPRFFRDTVYRLVARYRYRIFGKSESCRLPTPAERSVFLS